jgi:hypothetical protein
VSFLATRAGTCNLLGCSARVAGHEAAIQVGTHANASFKFMAAAFPHSQVRAEVQIAFACYYSHVQVGAMKILRLLSELWQMPFHTPLHSRHAECGVLLPQACSLPKLQCRLSVHAFLFKVMHLHFCTCTPTRHYSESKLQLSGFRIHALFAKPGSCSSCSPV